ncbi:MAG: flagellar basal body P-ring formation protein FlgA [Nitrosomonas sp.]|nr:MAG: flagellar basal body P-ring formation protein FlgA [Nitrosomonas sp.]
MIMGKSVLSRAGLTSFWIALSLFPGTSTIAQSSTNIAHQEIALIKNAIEVFLYNNTANLPGQVMIQVGQIDNQLKLPKCQQLQPFVPQGNRLWGKTSIGVRCESETTAWTIYVQTEINVMADVLHIARPISSGHPINYEDIAFQNANLTQMPDTVFTDINQVIGKVATTHLAAGQPLRPQMLRAPYVILRGQSVNLVVQGRGFAIRSEGKALTDAAEGQIVQVRNQSGKIITGLARNNSIVEIQP